MAHMIHARKTGDNIRFRVWSTSSDSYITMEMTETELREWTLKVAVCDAIQQYLDEIDGRVQRTIQNGTSSLMGDARDLNDPWDKERK
ncbi:MAG: hypothetical protein AAB673_01860 [Patescibacteria group bacterium]